MAPDAGITLVELFGGIGTGLAAVLEAGLTVRRYVYVDNSQVSIRVARHHLHQLMVKYTIQLSPHTIRGCFSHLPCDVTLISEADLRHLGPVDTNLTSSSTLATIFSAVPPPFDQKVDHILDPNRTSLPVVRDDLPLLALVNKVGAPRRAFSTFITFPQSFAFRDLGSGYGVGC